VRGIIAGLMGRKYWGCDLSQKQISANKQQAESIIIKRNEPKFHVPVWITGDSLTEMYTAPQADFILTCPPYGQLEKYSDDPRDLSNMDYNTFIDVYGKIISISIEKLKDNRFCAIVVGNFRNKLGFYEDFVGDTVRIFQKEGAKLYNDAILVNQIGTGAIRASSHFDPGRKLVKMHQNVLVFCKGDWRQATQELKTGGVL